MLKKTGLLITLLVLAIFVALGSVSGESLSGNEVLNKVSEVSEAETVQITFEMEIHGSRGGVRNRELEVLGKEGEREKRLIRFLAPADIAGTGLLSIEENDEEDMHLYLPALDSVRRIVSDEKSDRFMETDFTYNDLALFGGGNYSEDYQAEVLEKTAEDYLLEIIPVNEDIEYSYGEMRVDSNDWYPREIKFYDQSGELYKILTNDEIKMVDSNLTAHKVKMEDVQRKTKTILYLTEVSFDKEIEVDKFTVRYLRRY